MRDHESMRGLVLVLLFGTACDRADSAAPEPREPPAIGPALRVELLSPRPPPPAPPPPPPVPAPRPPPDEIARFLREHADAPGDWRVTLSRGKRRVVLPAGLAIQIVAHLGRDSSYLDGDDYNYVDDEVSIRIARGASRLDVIYDCGHLYLTPERHAGPWVLFSSEMVDLVESIRATVSV